MGAAVSFWWAYERGGGGLTGDPFSSPQAFAEFFLPVAKGDLRHPYFMGFTVTPQAGVSAEIEYARAATFPEFESISGCGEKSGTRFTP